MPQPRSRRHHTVPRFHLRGFANDKDQLAQLDVMTGRRSLVSINNASVVNDFYNVLLDDGSQSDAWEKWLSSVEGAAAPAIRRAIEAPIWNPVAQERHDIATWVAAQFLRGTGSRREQAQIKAMTFRMQIGMGGIEYLRHAIETSIGHTITDDQADVLWADLTGRGAVWTVNAGEHGETIRRTIQRATALIHDRAWHRVRFTRHQLAINDTPVALVPSEGHPDFLGVGLANAGFVTVALNRYTMLWMSDVGDMDFDMDPTIRLARAHNSSVLFNADRFVYFHPDDNPIPDLPMPRPERTLPDVMGPDMTNRDRPLKEVLEQISEHDYGTPSMIADYTWPLPGYVPPLQL